MVSLAIAPLPSRRGEDHVEAEINFSCTKVNCVYLELLRGNIIPSK